MTNPKGGALLPCPFCGGEAKYWAARDSYHAYVSCYPCSVKIGDAVGHAVPDVIKKWNTRIAPTLENER